MDEQRFDALTRLVSTGASRRTTLKGVLAWAAKGAALAGGATVASALVPSRASAQPVGNYCDCSYICKDERRRKICTRGTSCPESLNGCRSESGNSGCAFGTRSEIC
jgi:hypothetical protein